MKQTISKIRAELQAADVSRLPVFINTYKEDDRAGVRKLADIARKKADQKILRRCERI